MITEGAINGSVLTLRWLRFPVEAVALGTGTVVVVLTISVAHTGERNRRATMPAGCRATGLFRIACLLHRALSRALRRFQSLFNGGLPGQSCRDLLPDGRADALEFGNGDILDTDIGYRVLGRLSQVRID